MDDVDCVAGERPWLDPADQRGLAIDEAKVVFWGLYTARATPACVDDDEEE
jgi:hypothetical protein